MHSIVPADLDLNPPQAEIERRVDHMLSIPAFAMDPGTRRAELLTLLRAQLANAAGHHPDLSRYFDAWPIDYRAATRIADLPYLPVGVFKANPPLTLVASEQITRVLASSATTGQVPSRVVLDAQTARRMTRGVVSIIRDFIGSMRRPYLVIDTAERLAGDAELGARAAAVQGLRSFATEIVSALQANPGIELKLDETKLFEFAARHAHTEVLVYGFTYIIWQHLIVPLKARGICLRMPNIHVLHSGGWKRLQDQAVTRDIFAKDVAAVFGCTEDRIVDFYGMVENVGIIYPDCECGNKHVPAFAEVIVRDPLTLEPVVAGQQGLLQVCSVLPTSFPGFLLLTEDLGEVVQEDGCACGRRGISFRFVKRVPKAETRGCGNIDIARERPVPTGASGV